LRKKTVVERIPLDLIDPPSTAIRESIDMEKIRELAESIRERGLLNPITLARRGERYEVVAGHRRYLAHRLLEVDTIEAICRDVDESEMLFARAVENLQREDLRPMEVARVYAAIRDSKGLSIEAVARSVGKTKVTVWKYLQLLELPVDFQRAVDGGMLSISVAAVLMRIDDEPSRKYYLQNAVEHGITEKVALMWVDDFEKTRRGQFYAASGGEGGEGGIPEVPPSYVACQACFEPVDVRLVKVVSCCDRCFRVITGPKAQGG